MRMKLAFAVVCVSMLSALGRAQTPVGLVHGFSSGGETWGTTRAILLTDSLFSVPVPVSLPATAYVGTQAAVLRPWMSVNGLFSNRSLIVAHSMGGVLTRYVSHDSAVGGLLTIGTPHFGAPIAGSVDFIIGQMYGFAALWGTADALSADYAFASYPFNNDLWGIQYWLPAGGFPLITGIGVGLGLVYGRNDAMADLAPPGYSNSSGFIGALTADSAAEQIGIRWAARGELTPDDYYLGPWVLATDHPSAVAASELIQYSSIGIFSAAMTLLSDLNNNEYWDEDWFYHSMAAWAAIDVAVQLWNFPSWWTNDVVGGYPNDGLIPAWSQVGPRFTIKSLAGIAHTHETGAALYIQNRLREMKTLLPPP